VLEQESGRLETPDKREEKQDFSPEE